jgi:hypothetical protein
MKYERCWSRASLILAIGSSACAPEIATDSPDVRTLRDQLSGTEAAVNNSKEAPWGATGYISYRGRICTGTLIARTKVLTAKHCVIDDSGEVRPTAEMRFELPDALPYFVERAVAHPEPGILGPHDLAVLTLKRAVSEQDVPSIPRVFYGDISTAWQSENIWGPGLLVGFGGFGTPAQNSEQHRTYGDYEGTNRFDRNRRVGIAGDDDVGQLAGGALLAKGFSPFWQWQRIRTDELTTAPGDSGGPLFLRDAQGWILAGVASASWYDQRPGYGQEVDFDIWAPTGNVGGLSNTDFILRALGGDSDADADGVPDDVDNCPAVACSTPRDCANPDQLDHDNDGIGEVCDNCPRAICDELGEIPNAFCFNPEQLDGDGDRIGDTCDLCPLDHDPSRFQADLDSDGVGDLCDSCAGVDSRYAACADDSRCGENSRCIVEVKGGSGHCDQAPDGDSDGIPDACDNCLDYPNNSNVNSNALSENREQAGSSDVEVLGDECDPVPVVRLLPQESSPATSIGAINDGVGADDTARIDGESVLGGGVEGFSADVTYRHCSCIDPVTGAQLLMDECVGARRACPWTDPENNEADWRGMSLANASGSDRIPPYGLSTEIFNSDARAVDKLWFWREDLLDGRIEGESACTSLTDCRSYGAVLATTGANVTTSRSERDERFDLRDVFQMFSTPRLHFPEFEPPKIRFKCLGAGCLPRWIRADLRINVLDVANVAISQLRDVSLILPTDSGAQVVPRSGGPALVANDLLSPAVSGAVSDDELQWLSPAESGELLRSRSVISEQGSFQAALLPNDFAAGHEPDLVLSTPGGMLSLKHDLFAEQGDGGGGVGDETKFVRSGQFSPFAGTAASPLVTAQAIAATSPSALSPGSRSGAKGVFSGLELATYMVGGVSDATGMPAGGVWKFSARNRSWQNVAPVSEHTPSASVFGVAYYQPHGKLYVLDLNDRSLFASEEVAGPLSFFASIASLKVARLVEYDVHTGKSRQLVSWPYFGLYQSLDLIVDGEGSLVVVGARHSRYRAWRFDASDDGLIPLGTLTGRGRVASGLVMGDSHPTLAVERGGEMTFRTLDPQEFGRHRACWL